MGTVLKRGAVSLAAMLGRRMMGDDRIPIRLPVAPIRRPPTGGGSGGNDWIAERRMRVNADGLFIWEAVQHTGTLPPNLTRFVGVLQMTRDGIPCEYPIPILVQDENGNPANPATLRDAFALFKGWLNEQIAQQEKAAAEQAKKSPPEKPQETKP